MNTTALKSAASPSKSTAVEVKGVSKAPNRSRWSRIALILTMLVLVWRLVSLVGYARLAFILNFDNHFYESTMVHWAKTVAEGRTLYPDWRAHPYDANFYSPGYFWLVGSILRLGPGAGADPMLAYMIGRIISMASAVVAAVALGIYLLRRHGPVSALFGALTSITSMTLFGFGVMVRPDLLADTLGLIGFLVALSATPLALVSSIILLTFAIFTKQSAVLYLFAVLIAHLRTNRAKRGWLTLIGVASAGAIAAVTLDRLFEPRMIASMLGQAGVPWSVGALLKVLWKAFQQTPELFPLTIWGFSLLSGYSRRRREEQALFWVAAGIGVVSLLRIGSDLNYLLMLRHVAAIVAARVWDSEFNPLRAARTRLHVGATTALPIVYLFGTFGLCGLIPSIEPMSFSNSIGSYQQFQNVATDTGGRQALQQQESVRRLYKNKKLLTDIPRVAMLAGESAFPHDPWLFRQLVNSGRIDTTDLHSKLESGDIDLVITQVELERLNAVPLPGEESYENRDDALPKSVAVKVRDHYRLAGKFGPGWSVYLHRKFEKEPDPDRQPNKALPQDEALPQGPRDLNDRDN